MAGAWGCESCREKPLKGLREGLKGLRKGLKGLKGLKRLRPGKRQPRTPSKTDGWSVKLRELPWKAVERLAGGFEGFEGFEGYEESCRGQPWKGLREGLKACGRV